MGVEVEMHGIDVEEYVLPVTIVEIEFDARRLKGAISMIEAVVLREEGLRDRGEAFGFSDDQVESFRETARCLRGMYVERAARIAIWRKL